MSAYPRPPLHRPRDTVSRQGPCQVRKSQNPQMIPAQMWARSLIIPRMLCIALSWPGRLSLAGDLDALSARRTVFALKTLRALGCAAFSQPRRRLARPGKRIAAKAGAARVKPPQHARRTLGQRIDAIVPATHRRGHALQRTAVASLNTLGAFGRQQLTSFWSFWSDAGDIKASALVGGQAGRA